MMTQPLNEAELELIDQVAIGRMADFSNNRNADGFPITEIRAIVLRRLVLGIPFSPDFSASGVSLDKPIETPNGIRLRGAVIKGTLDFSDGGRERGEECPALIIQDCRLLGDTEGENREVGIDARHVHMKRLEVKDCRFRKLDISGAELSGVFDFSGAQSLAKDGECQVIAREVRIDGTVRAAYAQLRLDCITSIHPDQAREYALDLKGAEIKGSVMLRPRFKCVGGIVVSNCKISDDLWLDGAELDSTEGDAFAAQMGRIDGVTAMRALRPKTCADADVKCLEPFRANGTLNFFQATLGTLDLSGAVLFPATKDSDPDGLVLSAPLVSIRGNLLMGAMREEGVACPFIANGTINLSNATVGGEIMSHSARFGSVHAPDLTVRGDVTLHEELRGDADISGARIEGHMSLGYFPRSNRVGALGFHVCANGDAHECEIILDNSRIGQMRVAQIEAKSFDKAESIWGRAIAKEVRSCTLKCYPTKRLQEVRYEAPGEKEVAIISFLSDSSGQPEIILSGDSAPIHKMNSSGEAESVLKLGDDEQVSDYLRFFCANVWGEEGAFIIVEQKDVSDLSETVRSQIPERIIPVQSADKSWTCNAGVVYANYLFKANFKIPQDGKVEMLKDEPLQEHKLEPTVVYSKPFRLTRDTRMSLAEAFKWPLTVDGNWSKGTLPTSSFKGSLTNSVETMRTMRAKSKKLLPGISVSLRGTKVDYLDDAHGNAWGQDAHLCLDGFIYDRIETGGSSTSGEFNVSSDSAKSRDEESGQNAKEIISARKKWLMKQYKGIPSREFTPQPFDHLVKILRASGLYDGADEITILKLQLESRVKFSRFYESRFWSWFRSRKRWVQRFRLSWLRSVVRFIRDLTELSWDLLFDWCFKFGLRISHAFVTCAVLIVGGYIGVEMANYGHVRYPPWSFEEKPPPEWVPAFLRVIPPEKSILIVENTPVSTGAMQGQESANDGNKLVIRATEEVDEIPCHEAIDSLWYAIDVAIPVLDLNQESKCTVSSGSHAWGWRLGKQIYAIIGALITSLTVLTVSGILRRHLSRSD